MAIYQELSKEEFNEKIHKAFEILKNCNICPRKCNVNRVKGEKGMCRSGLLIKISSAFPHFGEEPMLVGKHGSGTIFFSNCNLSCVFCQNWEISHRGEGQYTSIFRLSELMLYLQKLGCHNINLVSPTHFVPQIILTIKIARDLGLRVPLVYNTGGYDAIKTLRLLDGIIDIYMPDIKYGEDGIKYSGVMDYFSVAKKAIKEMYRQVGDLIIEDGIAVKGLLVRHLVLPNNVAKSENVIKFISSLSKNTFVNIMNQYRPCYMAHEFKELSRSITEDEYKKLINIAKRYGLKNIIT